MSVRLLGVRQRRAFTLEEAVRKLSFDNASAWELNDRGPGVLLRGPGART